MSGVFSVAIGGFFGAMARFTVGCIAQQKQKSSFPAGTFIVNIFGSFLLGFLLGFSVEKTLFTLLGIGFLGAFTTFSTMNIEAIQLFEKKQFSKSIIYLFVSYIVGIMMAIFGFWLGQIL